MPLIAGSPFPRIVVASVLAVVACSDDGAVTPAPAGLTAEAISAREIALAWSDAASSPIALERHAGDGAFAEVAAIEAGERDYVDGDLQPDTTYTYRLRAGGAAGDEVAATTARDLHVDPAATAGGDGTPDRPFASLYEAVAVIDPAWSCELFVHAGVHELPDTVEIPAGAELTIQAGATLKLGLRAMFVAFRRTHVAGTEEAPVTFTWLAEGQPWGVMALYQPTADGSLFERCVYEHGSIGSHGGFGFTGALSIHDVEATVSHCSFRDNTGDDGLNVKRAWGRVEYCTFEGGLDGLDFDGNPGGEIVYNRFLYTGNDGIDLGMGSLAYAAFNYVVGVGDKGVSIGEGSAPTVEHNVIVDAAVGIAIKDGSQPLVAHNTVVGAGVGLAGYEAVAGSGGGAGVVTHSIIWGSSMADVDFLNGTTTEVTWSCVETGWIGEGNTSAGAGCDDPLFADPAGQDFHLRSQGGRFDPATGTFVSDAETSPCIDAGDPAADFSLETMPNGGRANLGAYGNTAEASRTP